MRPYATTLHPAPCGFSQQAASFFRLSLNCSSHCAWLCRLPGLIQCDCGKTLLHALPPGCSALPMACRVAAPHEFMLPMRWQVVQVLPRVEIAKGCDQCLNA